MAVPMVLGSVGLIATLFRFLFKHLPAVVVYIMTFLGITAVTYTGVTVLLGQVETIILEQWSVLSAPLIGAIKLANVDKVLTLYLSLMTFKASIGAVRSFRNQYTIKHGGAAGQ